MTSRSTIRYAAKQAYQLMIMRAIYDSTQCGLPCLVYPIRGYVVVWDDNIRHEIKIAKAWANL